MGDAGHVRAAVGDRCVSWCPECNRGAAKDPSVLSGVKDRAGRRKRLSAPPVWREMTEEEEAMVRALSRCRFVPGTPDKRFVRHLHEQLAAEGKKISVAQAAKLRRAVLTFRRQIPASVVSMAKASVTAAEREAEQAALLWAHGHTFDAKKQEAIAARMVELDAQMEQNAPNHAALTEAANG